MHPIYQFSDSKALEGSKFVGLPIDEDFEAHLPIKGIKLSG